MGEDKESDGRLPEKSSRTRSTARLIFWPDGMLASLITWIGNTCSFSLDTVSGRARGFCIVGYNSRHAGEPAWRDAACGEVTKRPRMIQYSTNIPCKYPQGASTSGQQHLGSDGQKYVVDALWMSRWPQSWGKGEREDAEVGLANTRSSRHSSTRCYYGFHTYQSIHWRFQTHCRPVSRWPFFLPLLFAL